MEEEEMHAGGVLYSVHEASTALSDEKVRVEVK